MAPAQHNSSNPQARSPEFLQAAQRLADMLVEDVGKVASGAQLTYRGVTFSLKHHTADPDALVLAIEIAGPAAAGDARVCKALLQCNLATPVTRGYYAVAGEGDGVAWCERIDFTTEPDPAGRVAFILEQLATGKEAVGGAIKDAVDAAIRRARPSAFVQ